MIGFIFVMFLAGLVAEVQAIDGKGRYLHPKEQEALKQLEIQNARHTKLQIRT